MHWLRSFPNIQLTNFFYEAEKRNIVQVLDKIQIYCQEKINVFYKRLRFNGKTQQNGWSFHNFLTNFIKLAKTCQFVIMHDALLGDQIVVAVRNNALRKQFLQKKELTLSEFIVTLSERHCLSV